MSTKDEKIQQLIGLFKQGRPYCLCFIRKRAIYKTYKPLLDRLVDDGKCRIIENTRASVTYEYTGS